jgi:hypothetical protein
MTEELQPKRQPADGIHVPKHVALDIKVRLMEAVLYRQEYSEYYLQGYHMYQLAIRK